MESLADRRKHNDAIRASFPPGAMFSGPSLNTLLEGWLRLGFRNGPITHYWRRGGTVDAVSLCGLQRSLTYTIRGQLMVFEIGNFPKCSKCSKKRPQVQPIS